MIPLAVVKPLGCAAFDAFATAVILGSEKEMDFRLQLPMPSVRLHFGALHALPLSARSKKSSAVVFVMLPLIWACSQHLGT